MAISTFMGLETNKRGLTAQQTSLYTVGNNISNANTVGYTRQRVNLVSTTGFPSAGMNSPMVPGHLGTGVTSDSITRIRDQFLDKQYRQETNTLGFWSQQTNAISQMEDIMSEPSEYGLNKAFDEFYTAWQEVANTPNNAAARQVVYTKASNLASSFNYMNKQMTLVQTNLKYEALNTVDNVNTILQRIASLNNQIKTVEPNGYIPNELYDARDLLLDELSEYMPISVENLYSGGIATDAAEGAINVYLIKADGSKEALVSAEPTGTQNYNGRDRTIYGKSTAVTLSLTTDNEGTITDVSKSDTFQAFAGIGITKKTVESLKFESTTEDGVSTFTSSGYKVVTDASGGITVTTANGDAVTADVDADTGDLIIKVDAITGDDGAVTEPAKTVRIKLTQDAQGKVTGGTVETSEEGKNIAMSSLALEKGKLTSYAVSYGYTTNATDDDGKLAVSGFYAQKLADLDTLAREFANAFNEIHQSGYGLSPDGTGSPTGLEFFSKNNETDDEITAANIKINDEMKDFNNIAASNRDNEEGNGNLALQLSNLKTTAIEGLNNTSAGKFYEAMVADTGTQGEKAQQMEYNSGTIQLTISNNRDSVTSVSLDEEMTDMIKFQQAYNASARMMTTIDETLEKIINGMGRVGL
jgi:flagellar hook-associated protein 1